MLHTSRLMALGVVFLAVPSGWLAVAGTYKVTDLGTLPGGSYTRSSASAINARGEVVGTSDSFISEGIRSPETHRPVCRAFLFSNGKMTDLGVLLKGSYSHAESINASGQVVGYADTPSGHRHAFLYSNGKMTDLGTLGGSYITSIAHAINDNGQVVGESDTAETTVGERHAFLYIDGKMTDLGTLLGSGIKSGACSINAHGQVVGYTFEGSGRTWHAFLYSNGAMTRLGGLGGSSSCAYSINGRGQIAGDADTFRNAKTHAFLFSNGRMTDLGILSSYSWSHARGINASGQVVGMAFAASGQPRAVLYDSGKVTDLNTVIDPSSGWVLKSATAINDLGWIAGDGTHGGAERAFLLTPVP
jgi:probable HAF family extracellular repeat protein